MDYDKAAYDYKTVPHDQHHNQTHDPYGVTMGKKDSGLFRNPNRVGKGYYRRSRGQMARELYDDFWDRCFGGKDADSERGSNADVQDNAQGPQEEEVTE